MASRMSFLLVSQLHRLENKGILRIFTGILQLDKFLKYMTGFYSDKPAAVFYYFFKIY